ncbi:hypothetical protein U1Q18_045288 [Sarracenia purpurea var. burkii]
MNTLMTHQQISCIDRPISLRCPSGTNVIIKLARYANASPGKESPACDAPNLIKSSSYDTKQTNCEWPKALQYSLLQTAVEVCRSKEQCQFQVSLGKFGVEPCPGSQAQVEVEYNCRPGLTVKLKLAQPATKCTPCTRVLGVTALASEEEIAAHLLRDELLFRSKHITYSSSDYLLAFVPTLARGGIVYTYKVPANKPVAVLLLHSFSSKVGCEHEKVNFECEPNTRLAIYSASYGRTQYQSVQCPQPQGVAEEIPRKVLLQKFEDGPDQDEYPIEEIDQHDILDNPESLAPSPDIAGHGRYNESNSSSAILLQHPASNSVHNTTFTGETHVSRFKHCLYAAATSSGSDKYQDNGTGNMTLPHPFNDEISEVDADITLAEVMPPVTIIPSLHHISPPGEVEFDSRRRVRSYGAVRRENMPPLAPSNGEYTLNPRFRLKLGFVEYAA